MAGFLESFLRNRSKMKGIFIQLLLLLSYHGVMQAQDKPVDSLQHALNQYTKEDTLRVRKLLALAKAFPFARFKEAETTCKQAAALSLKLGYTKGEAQSYDLLIHIYSDHKQFDKCTAAAFRAIDLATAIKDTTIVFSSNLSLGNAYRYMGNTELAEVYELRALKIAQAMQNQQLMLQAFVRLAVMYSEGGHWDKSHQYADSSVRLANILQDTTIRSQMIYLNGTEQEEKKNYPEAKKYFLQYLDCQIASGNHILVAWANVRLSIVSSAMKQVDSALLYAKRSIQIDDEYNFDHNSGFDAMYHAYLAGGDYSNALKYHLLSDSLDRKSFSMDAGLRVAETRAQADQEKKDAIAQAALKRQQLIRNGSILFSGMMLLFVLVFYRQRNKLSSEKRRSDALLLNILPEEVASELKTKGSTDARLFDQVTVMFTDIKGFTQLSEKLTPSELVEEIDTCFKAFDEIIGKYDIEKIKTIGDSYMCAGGLPVVNTTHAEDVVNAALDIQQYMQHDLLQRKSEGRQPFEIRIGIHTGPVVAGIVGVKKFAYDIWGDTVNIASKMESTGEAGKVNISGSTYALVKEKFNCRYRGKIPAKNKGEIDMYFVERVAPLA